MSLSSRLSLGNLRRHRLAIFLFGAIALCGAVLLWKSQSVESAGFEAPMARYALTDTFSVDRWIMRPDGLGGLGVAYRHPKRTFSVQSFHCSLADVTQMAAPMASNDVLSIPSRGKTLLEDSDYLFAIYSPASDRIAVANSMDVHVFDAATHAKFVRLAPPPVRVHQAAFSWDAKWLAAVDVGKEVFLWNLVDGSGPRIVPIVGSTQVAFGANADEMLVIKTATDCEIWSLTSLQRISVLPPVAAVAYAASAVSQHGDRLAIAASDGTISVWKLADRMLETRINPSPVQLLNKMQICFAGSDDSLVATRHIYRRKLQPIPFFPYLHFVNMARTSEFYVWSVSDWRLRRSWQNTCSNAVFPDGDRLDFADLHGNTLRVWPLRPPAAK